MVSSSINLIDYRDFRESLSKYSYFRDHRESRMAISGGSVKGCHCASVIYSYRVDPNRYNQEILPTEIG